MGDETLLCVKCWVRCEAGNAACAACGGELVPVTSPRAQQILASSQQPSVVVVQPHAPKKNTGDAVADFIGKLIVAIILVAILGALVAYCAFAGRGG